MDLFYFSPLSSSNALKMMELHFPHGPHRLHFLSIPSSALSACFWLVVAYEIVIQQQFKASVYFIALIFLSFNLMVQTIGQHPPTHPPPRRLDSSKPLPGPLTIGLIVLSNHKTAATRGQPPSHHSLFLMRMNSLAQTKEPAKVRVIPMPRA